jgi:hypothetical protein
MIHWKRLSVKLGNAPAAMARRQAQIAKEFVGRFAK